MTPLKKCYNIKDWQAICRVAGLFSVPGWFGKIPVGVIVVYSTTAAVCQQKSEIFSPP